MTLARSGLWVPRPRVPVFRSRLTRLARDERGQFIIRLPASSQQPAGLFDTSEYRANTYGPPTHYCDPTRSLSSPGAGTLENPWNLNQAMTLAVGGNVVGLLPGVSVELPTTDNDNIPAFRPSNSGTAGNRIVFVTKFAAIALANVETNALRTQLRHDGGPDSTNGPSDIGDACPLYGTLNTNYATFDGIYTDISQAWPCADGGVIRAEGAIGTHFLNFVIKGATVNLGSNPVIYRPQDTVDTVLHNFRAYDFDNDPTGASVPQQGLFSDQYGDRNFLIEYFEIRNTDRGPFPKGTSGGGTQFNYGTMRYGIIDDMRAGSCIRLNDLHGSNITELHHLILSRYYSEAIAMTGETTAVRNLLVHHITAVRGVQNANGPSGGHRAENIGSNVRIRDSIWDFDGGAFGHGADWSEASVMATELDYNHYREHGAGSMTFAWNGNEYPSLAAFAAAIGGGREQHSTALVSDPFVNRAAGDYRIAPGHQFLTASSTGGQVGAHEGGITPGPYGSYGF